MRRAPPPLNALRAFEAFARHGSMTAAAEELCVTHGAVSRQVKQLQDHLGVSLVEGPRHRLGLTEAGRRLADELSGPFDAIGRASAQARGGGRRELEVSCLGTFAMKWLIPRLPGFLDAHPGLKVRVSESYAAVDFRRDRFDAAIRIRDHGDPGGDEASVAFMSNFQGPVCAPSLAHGLDEQALFALPRLYSSTFPIAWSTWASMTGRPLPPARVEREFAHNHSLVEAAAAGLGAAVVPWAFVAPDIATGRLMAPFGFVRRPSDFVLLRPQGRADAALETFQAWLIDEARATPEPAP